MTDHSAFILNKLKSTLEGYKGLGYTHGIITNKCRLINDSSDWRSVLLNQDTRLTPNYSQGVTLDSLLSVINEQK